jgi:dephospho-CoA kinase
MRVLISGRSGSGKSTICRELQARGLPAFDGDRIASAFDHVFVLNVPPDIQRTRILARTEHDYGKLPAMQDQIITEQRAFVFAASQTDAILLDATQSPAAIVTAVLEHTHAN